MSCEVCRCQVGLNYLVQGHCALCGEFIQTTGTYMGRFGNMHKFRLHPRLPCPGCEEVREFSTVPCDDLLDVTEEFSVMFHEKESHWVGGSNAKRQSE